MICRVARSRSRIPAPLVRSFRCRSSRAARAAILGFEAIGKKVVVTDDDAIAIRSMGFVTLSWDHRVIDGAEASQFLALLKKRIETMDFSSELAHYL